MKQIKMKFYLSVPAILVTISLVTILFLTILSSILGTSNNPCLGGGCHSSNEATEYCNLLPSDAQSTLPTTFQTSSSQDVKMSVEVSASGSKLSSWPSYFVIQTLKVTLSSVNGKVTIPSAQQQVSNKNPGDKFAFTWSVSGSSSGTDTLKFDLWAYNNHNNEPSRAATFIDTYQYDITVQGVPYSPTNFQLKAGDSFVYLTWSQPEFDGGVGITKYNVYKGTSSGTENKETSASGSTFSYNDTSVTNNQKYYYYITAENTFGESSPSIELSETPKSSKTVPNPPQNVTAVSGRDFIDVSWEEPTYVGGTPITEYRLFRDTQPGVGSLYQSLPAGTTKYKDEGLTSGTTYYYYIRATNIIGPSETSKEVSGTPDAELPIITITSPPNNTYINSKSAFIEWQGSDAISGIDHYELRLNDDAWIEVGTEEYYSFYSLPDGINDIFVKAMDGVGNYRQTYITIIVDLEAPAVNIISPVNGSMINSTDVVIEWNCSDSLSGLDHYEIKLDDGIWKNVGLICKNELSSLTDGVHIFQVKAVDVTKNSMIAQTSFNVDATPPSIKSNTPFGTDVDLTTSIIITFSEEMYKSSVSILAENISGSLTWNEASTELTLEPSTDFEYETEYEIKVFGKDLFMNHLVPFTWIFKTKELPKINGRVVDENNNPIFGVNITIGSKLASTNSGGYFTVKLQPGVYKLTITKAGYSAMMQNVTITDEKVKNIGVVQLAPVLPPDNERKDDNQKATSDFPWLLIIILVTVIIIIIVGVLLNTNRLKGK